MRNNPNLKIGDFITAYRKGIHVITKIQRRFYEKDSDIPSIYKDSVKIGDEYSSLIFYKTVINGSGNLEKSQKEHACDAGFCGTVERFLDEEKARIEKFENNLDNVGWVKK